MNAQETPASSEGRQVVRIQAIRVKGSRLPEKSIAHLTGLQAGQNIDEAKLRKALHDANQSGLFKNISYNYESVADSTDVILDLEIEDQLPLIPAAIRIRQVNPDDVWHYLEAFDPLFTHDLPPSTNAINLYARYIKKYLESIGVNDVDVVGNVLGKGAPASVEFVSVKLRTIAPK